MKGEIGKRLNHGLPASECIEGEQAQEDANEYAENPGTP
jgi:hypothetical protein